MLINQLFILINKHLATHVPLYVLVCVSVGQSGEVVVAKVTDE